VACCAAALHGRDTVSEDDAALAARCVLASRATQWPEEQAAPGESPEDQSPEQPPEAQSSDSAASDGESGDAGHEDKPSPPQEPAAIEDRVLDAAKAAIPACLLAAMKLGAMNPTRGAPQEAGALNASRLRGGQRCAPRTAGCAPEPDRDVARGSPWQATPAKTTQAGRCRQHAFRCGAVSTSPASSSAARPPGSSSMPQARRR
jgi:magnesium chelatase subunit D